LTPRHAKIVDDIVIDNLALFLGLRSTDTD